MKKILILISVLLLFPLGQVKAVPTSANFGGKVVAAIPCTCPPFGLWISYTPFFLNSSVPIVGSLYYPLTSILYAYWAIGVPGTWELGAFTPGPGACQILTPSVPPACVPLPAMGTIKYVGTSLFPSL